MALNFDGNRREMFSIHHQPYAFLYPLSFKLYLFPLHIARPSRTCSFPFLRPSRPSRGYLFMNVITRNPSPCSRYVKRLPSFLVETVARSHTHAHPHTHTHTRSYTAGVSKSFSYVSLDLLRPVIAAGRNVAETLRFIADVGCREANLLLTFQ